MKMFGIKEEGNDLYFQIEKAKNSLKVIDKISFELFGEKGSLFELRWQDGLPKKEDYEGYNLKGIYFDVVISQKRIHLILRGLKDARKKKKIKDIITKKYKF